MLRRYLSSFIITLFQWVILVLLSMSLIHQLLSSSQQLTTWAVFFKAHHHLFLLLHGVIYLAFYLLWPKAIALYSQRKNLHLEARQMEMSILARRYIVGLLVLLDVLFQARLS